VLRVRGHQRHSEVYAAVRSVSAGDVYLPATECRVNPRSARPTCLVRGGVAKKGKLAAGLGLSSARRKKTVFDGANVADPRSPSKDGARRVARNTTCATLYHMASGACFLRRKYDSLRQRGPSVAYPRRLKVAA
jgi:hypothetical protein